MILCYFTVALSPKAALAPSVSPVSNRCLCFTPSSPRCWCMERGTGNLSSFFSAVPLQCSRASKRQTWVISSHATFLRRLGKYTLVPPQPSADLLVLEQPWSCGRAGGADPASCSAPLNLSPGAVSLQPTEQGGGTERTGEIGWQKHAVLQKSRFQSAQVPGHSIASWQL